MTDWSGGYVTDVEYTRAFQREQAPSHLDLVCLLKGVAPPNASEPARYCDLGCGDGYTATLLAAADAGGEYWGIDFNPAHIARGRAFQAETGITNLHLHEAAFADLGPELPPFDYIALHGVYTWVGPAERQAIVQFIDTHLKPGGIVYVGYNALPNWGPELPFQRALSSHARQSRERSDRAVAKAIDFVKRLRDAGASELNRPAIIAGLEQHAAAGRHRYLAHEYLTTQWSPIYHEDLARQLAAAKLEYVGSAELLENFSQLYLTPAQRQLCEEAGGGAAGETIKDYFLTRSFRTDVFVRGKRPLSSAQQRTRLRAIELGLLIPFNEIRYEFIVPVGKSQLSETLYRPIFAALERGPMTIGELLALPEVAGTNATAVELLGMLIGTRQAMPCTRALDDAARQRVARFNARVALQAIEEGDGYAALAAPGARSGVYLTQIQTLVFTQLIAGAAIDPDGMASAIAGDMARRGVTLSAGGKPLGGRDATYDALRAEIRSTIDSWAPCWRQLGAL